MDKTGQEAWKAEVRPTRGRFKFTVVLKRPDVVADTFGNYRTTDIYVALNKADSLAEAVSKAQREAYESDKEDLAERNTTHEELGTVPDSYLLQVLFAGHCDAKLFGWQVL